ncbi:MAG TPA: glycosyltransferase family 39 protein [Acidimicrobiales bacterium]|nr:glycosyltransferase family 39 protein [Acidimicrobiales bacterium]
MGRVRDGAARLPRHTSGAARLITALACLPLAAVVAVALAARVLVGIAFPAATADGYEFGTLARNIVEGDGYTYFRDDPVGRLEPDEVGASGDPLPSAYMPPAYTYATAAALEAGGGHAGMVWVLRGLHLAAAAAGVVCVDALARRLAGRAAGRLAAVGYALYPALVYVSTQVSSANVYLPLELAVLLGLLWAADAPSWRRGAVVGLGLGCLCLLRAEAVALVPLSGLWLVWTSGRDAARRPGLRLAPAATLVLAAATLPGLWLVRNAVTFDRPVATITTTGGKNLWIGNHAGASGSQKNFEIPGPLESELVDLPAGDDYEVRADGVFLRRALHDMRDDPLGTVLRDLRKAVLLLGADLHDPRNLNPLYLGPYLAVAALGVAGFVRWRRAQAPGEVWLVGGYVAVAVAVPVAFFALARYRLPIEVMLVIFAASAAATLADMPGVPERRTVSEVPA